MSPKRLLAVLTPIAAVGAVVAALVTTTGHQGGGEAGEAGATVGGGSAAALGTQTKESTQLDQSAKGYSLLVLGPAAEVAAELRQKGFEAQAVGNRVEVRNTTRAEVERALANRRTGRVRIVIVK